MQESFFDEPPPAAPAARTHEYEVPADAKIEHCRSCDAPIVWTRTLAGRAVPLALSTVQTRGNTKYAVSHFRDCPHARDWGR